MSTIRSVGHSIILWLLALALAGPAGAGVQLDGVDDRLTFGDLTAYDVSNQSTTVVVHFRIGPGSLVQYLIARRQFQTGPSGGWMARVDTNGTVTVRILDGGNIAAAESGTTGTVTDGALRNLVMILNTDAITSAGNAVFLWLNGVSDTVTRARSGNPYVPCLSPCPLTGGGLSDASSEWMTGTFQAIEIYPGALSANEIETLGTSRLQRPGLSRARLASWPLDTCPAGASGTSSNGVILPDRSGNGRDGVIATGANATGATCVASELSIPWGPQ